MADIDDIFDDEEDRATYATRGEPPADVTVKSAKPIATISAEEIAEMRARYLAKPTPLGRPRLTDPVRADMTRLLGALEALQDQAGSAMPGASRTLVAVVKAAGGEIHIPQEVLEGIGPRDAVVVKDAPLRGGKVVCAFKAPWLIPVAARSVGPPASERGLQFDAPPCAPPKESS